MSPRRIDPAEYDALAMRYNDALTRVDRLERDREILINSHDVQSTTVNSLKHLLVDAQMQLEKTAKDRDDLRAEVEVWRGRFKSMVDMYDAVGSDNARLRGVIEGTAEAMESQYPEAARILMRAVEGED